MAFFLKNGQGLLLVGQIILYIFLKIELNLPRHVRDEVLTRKIELNLPRHVRDEVLTRTC